MIVPNGWSLTGSGDGLMQGNIFPLQKENICIGTDLNACAIIYPSGATGISAIHCQLTFKNGSWLLTDFSDNGTWLNDVRLANGQPVPIKSGDEVMLANSSNVFEIKFTGGDSLPPPPSHQSGIIKEKYFTFSGRLNRKSYILRATLLSVIYFFLLIVAVMIVNPRYEEDILLVYFIAGVPTFIPGLSLLVRRFHDTDHSGWWYFTVLIPIFNLYTLYLLFFKKGTAGSNRYGEDPLS